MVNLKKIAKISELSFVNSLRLHLDSIKLFNNGSYPSALFLSVLAQEEVGKFYLLDDFVWHSTVNGRYDAKIEKEIISQILNHSIKQKFFVMQGGLFVDYHSFPKKFIKEVMSNNLEIDKQNSVYVGLSKGKGGLILGGKIKNPMSITKERSSKQITIISDYFIDYLVGIRAGNYTCDNENLERIIKSKKLLTKLELAWSLRGKRFAKRKKK